MYIKYTYQGDSRVNINLGAPYEAIIKRVIEAEYAGNKTEVIRQALLIYKEQLEEKGVNP